MSERSHTHSIHLPLAAGRVFALLVTPSDIRAWWGAARALVIPREGGRWIAAWGADEDDPDYVTAATLVHYDPPRGLLMRDFCYFAKTGPLPFRADLETAFSVEAATEGAVLTVRQSGFPCDRTADAFYAACEKGWHDTFESIARYAAGIHRPG